MLSTNTGDFSVMYIAVTIYTKYVVPNLVHPGAEFLHCCSTEHGILFSFLLMYFDAVPLAFFYQLFSPIFFFKLYINILFMMELLIYLRALL